MDIDGVDNIDRDNYEVSIGATEDGFLEFLNSDVGIRIEFAKDCYRTNRRYMMDALKDAFWKDYLEVCEWSYRAEMEKKLA